MLPTGAALKCHQTDITLHQEKKTVIYCLPLNNILLLVPTEALLSPVRGNKVLAVPAQCQSLRSW